MSRKPESKVIDIVEETERIKPQFAEFSEKMTELIKQYESNAVIPALALAYAEVTRDTGGSFDRAAHFFMIALASAYGIKMVEVEGGGGGDDDDEKTVH